MNDFFTVSRYTNGPILHETWYVGINSWYLQVIIFLFLEILIFISDFLKNKKNHKIKITEELKFCKNKLKDFYYKIWML